MLPPNLYARVRTFHLHCTRDRGCGAHPAFSAPSDFNEGKRDPNLGQNMSRERGHIFSRHSGARAARTRNPFGSGTGRAMDSGPAPEWAHPGMTDAEGARSQTENLTASGKVAQAGAGGAAASPGWMNLPSWEEAADGAGSRLPTEADSPLEDFENSSIYPSGRLDTSVRPIKAAAQSRSPGRSRRARCCRSHGLRAA